MIPKRIYSVIKLILEEESELNFNQPVHLLEPQLEQWFIDNLDNIQDLVETWEIEGNNYWITRDVSFLYLVCDILELIHDDIDYHQLAIDLVDEKWKIDVDTD